MRVRHDLHTHSTYSDGWDIGEMVAAASNAGLEGIGFADHCPIGPDTFGRRDRYDLSDTYEQRRPELTAAANEHGIDVYDAAEVNYDPSKHDDIAAFLEKAGFAYTIGSVHFTDDVDIAQPDLGAASLERRQEVVAEYVDWQVALIESELFDIVGHLDVVQRDPALRGVMDTEDYIRIADALASSRTVPEINAGRLDRSYGMIHPHLDRLAVFAEHEVSFVLGSDAHAPDQLTRRIQLLEDFLEDIPVSILQTPPQLA